MLQPLHELLNVLAGVYGDPVAPPRRTVFELVVLENVAYLVDDARRLEAFETLRREIGLDSRRLTEATGGQAHKLRTIGQITLDEFDGDLDAAIRPMPLKQAKRALMRFPSIGEPGAEKILLFARLHPVLGLESNGVRVLTRLGLVEEARSYAATYRNVQAYVAPFASEGIASLIRAHQLLRQHGQELCRRSQPMCERCPLTDVCAFYAGSRSG